MRRKRSILKPRNNARSNQRRKILKTNIHKKIVARRKAFSMASMLELDQAIATGI